MKPHMLILMGPPAVGKGTFSRMLGERHNFKHIETGAMLRAMPPESEIRQTIARGELVSDEMLFPLLQEQISTDGDMLLDGFPRTLSQAKWIVDQYADIFDIHVLYLEAPKEIIFERVHKRLREGSTRRDDANDAIVQRRLDTFYNTTIPAVDWLRTAPGIHFSTVDAVGTVDENFAEIVTALKKQK